MDGTIPCRGRLPVDPAQSTPKGRFVLRADSILPYSCGGRAADGSTSSRPLQLVYTIQPGTVENPKLRADSIRPYRGRVRNGFACNFCMVITVNI